MQTYIEKIASEAKMTTIYGKVADYIPALRKADPSQVGICVMDPGNRVYAAGDFDVSFSLQSISKTITLLLALMDRGAAYVFSKVGMEPTGDAFNSLKKLETEKPSKPFNPMINAGAIAVTAMIEGGDVLTKINRILALSRAIMGNESIQYNPKIFNSEKQTGNRNRSMAYFMKDIGIIEGDVEEALDVYFMQCAIEANCLDLSRLAYFFAHRGKTYEGVQLVDEKYCTIAKSFMVTCGMYNESGEYAIKVGIPSKSGVGGGIIAAQTDGFGIATFGPALNEKGNSVAGLYMMEKLSQKYELSIFR